MLQRLTLNSCFSLPSAGIIGVHSCAWLRYAGDPHSFLHARQVLYQRATSQTMLRMIVRSKWIRVVTTDIQITLLGPRSSASNHCVYINHFYRK